MSVADAPLMDGGHTVGDDKTVNARSAGTAKPRKAAGSPAALPGVKTRTTATRDNAAAFVAARQKMAPGKPVPSVTSQDDASKGLVEVAAKKVKRMVEDAEKAPIDEKAPVENADAATVPAVEQPVAAATVDNERPAAPKAAKPAASKGQGFKTGEFIVYPAHGVGQITAIEEQEVAGYKLELFVIAFVKDKMILKVPLPKIASVGMRKLAEPHVVKRGLDTLTGRARVKRTMWSRRAQEYEAKINSGDLVAIAEVVRDLYRSDAQPEQSYSERQLYEAALDRLARELAAVHKLTDSEALRLVDDQLQKGPRRTKVEEGDAEESDDAEESVGGINEAA